MAARSIGFALVARWGGDEFVVVLPGVTTADTVDRLADEVRSSARVTLDLGGRKTMIRGSVGVGMLAPGQAPEEAIGRADMAMYRDKRSSRRAISAG